MIRSLSVSGQQLATSDLLKVMNVDEAAFLEAVRRAAAATFDTHSMEQLREEISMSS